MQGVHETIAYLFPIKETTVLNIEIEATAHLNLCYGLATVHRLGTTAVHKSKNMRLLIDQHFGNSC